MKITRMSTRRATLLGALAVSSSATWAGEAPALKVMVRWNAFTPQILSPSAPQSEVVEQSRARLQRQLQSVVPGAWVGRTFAHVGWSVVAVPAASKTTALRSLRAAFGATNVEAVHRRRLYGVPNDPFYSSQYWLRYLGAPYAWDFTTGSSSVIVASLDTGAGMGHPDLVNNLWTNPGEPGAKSNNRVDDDGNGYVDDVRGWNCITPTAWPQDDDARESHGTHMAGIIGAQGNNAHQVSGINWNVKIVTVKVFDANGSTDDPTIAQGVDYILALKAKGVNVRAVNASWGGPDTSQALYSAFQKLDSAGILSFVAAGNGDANGAGYSLDTKPDYPSSYAFPSIVSVASTTRDDTRAYYSNYGARTVDIFAPGDSVLSLANGGRTAFLSGTSMSTAMATGAAALLWSVKPSLTGAQMKDLLLSSAYKAPALAGTCTSNGRLFIGTALLKIAPTPTPTPRAAASVSSPIVAPTPAPTAVPTPVPRSLSGSGGRA